jgi:hypothetical protein
MDEILTVRLLTWGSLKQNVVLDMNRKLKSEVKSKDRIIPVQAVETLRVARG